MDVILALTETAYAVCRRLLTPPPPLKILDVGRDVRPPIPQASVYKVVRWMKYHGAALDRPSGHSVDLRRMLDLLAATRVSNLLPTSTTATGLDLHAMHGRLEQARLAHVFAFSTAANLTAYFEPLESIQLYVPKGTSRTFAEIAGKGRYSVELFEEDLGKIPTQTSADGLPVTELLRTAIDVRAHPRGGPYATMLQDAIAKEAGL